MAEYRELSFPRCGNKYRSNPSSNVLEVDNDTAIVREAQFTPGLVPYQFLNRKEIFEYALELSTLNPDVNVMVRTTLDHDDGIPVDLDVIDVPLKAGDTVQNLEERWSELEKRKREAYHASPEGKKCDEKRARIDFRAKIKEEYRLDLLRSFVQDSKYKFPADMPSIEQIMYGEAFPTILSPNPICEESVRGQLIAGAQWILDHSNKQPFKNPQHTKELKDFLDQIDVVGQSGYSSSYMKELFKIISEKGFQECVAKLKEDAKALSIGPYVPPAIASVREREN